MLRTAAFRNTALSLLATGVCATSALGQSAENPRRADALFERANHLETQPTASFDRHLRRLAGMYLASAELRKHSDPRKAESLRRAGGLLMSLDPDRSRTLFEAAGDLALANRDAVQAAKNYVDAAWVVVNYLPTDPAAVQAASDCLHLAQELVHLPQVPTDQRTAILERIDVTTVIVTYLQTNST